MYKFSLVFAACFLIIAQNIRAQTVQGSIQGTGTANEVLVVAQPSVNLTSVRFSSFSVTISIPHQAVTPSATISANHLPHLNWTQITDLNYNGRDYYIFLGSIDVNNNTTVSWNTGQDNSVLNIQFSSGMGNTAVQLNDLTADNGGTTLQAYWYVELLGTGDVTNYTVPFYASASSGAPTNNAGGNSFVATSALVTLPLQLIYFTAEQQADKLVQLKWSTVNEVRFSKFEMERSLNGLSWATIGSAISKSVHGEQANYTFEDIQPLSNDNFYRLRMLDKDGSEAYSRVCVVYFDQKASLSIFPNPTAGVMNLTWTTGASETKLDIQLFDPTGRLIITKTIENNTTSVDLSTLAAGAYWLRVTTGMQTTSHRVVRL